MFDYAPPVMETGLLERQQSFDELGTPLAQVTFVVVDLETTGGSPNADEITEIGALKLRGGELLGRFETLVNPGVPIPPLITVLTGITEAMVLPAPPISEVLPPFLEFAAGAVIVGHNIRFDCSFLDAALRAHGYPKLSQRRVDTVALARRLIRDEVPNLKLSTLARHLRSTVEPVHRAYADAAATAEVLHALLERAATFGVLGLDDLIALPSMRAHPSASKLALTAKLPRTPGVYFFKDRDGRVLYVGKASNLRARVRSYFASDDRRKVPQLLREAVAIDHFECATPFEAEIRELRLIHELQPRFNRAGKGRRQPAYLKLTDERFPRVTVVRKPAANALGPFRTATAAHAVREAIESAIPLRRCTTKVGRRAEIVGGPPCVPAQLGVATCPCRGHVDEEEYGVLTDCVRRALTSEPDTVLGPLEARMQRLARDERYEEAAMTRDRLSALARALIRQRTIAMLRDVRIVVATPTEQVEIDNGRVVLDGNEREESIDELFVVARWLRENAAHLRVLRVDGVFASALPRVVDPCA
jgi:DNA polymerase-3 subunit epsilon